MTTATVTASNGNDVTVTLTDELVLSVSYLGDVRVTQDLHDQIPAEAITDELVEQAHQQVADTTVEQADMYVDLFENEDYFKAGEPDYSVCVTHELLDGSFEVMAMATAQDSEYVVMKVFGRENADSDLELVWRKRVKTQHGISAGDAIADFNPQVAEGLLMQVMLG